MNKAPGGRKASVTGRTKITAALALLAALLMSGCGEKVKPGAQEIKRAKVTGIRAEEAALSQALDYYETSGTVTAGTISVISSRVMGPVRSVRVKEGDRVAAGQLLLSVDDSDVTQRVRGASEGYQEAKKALQGAKERRELSSITYERYRRLYDEKALSGQELDQIATEKKVADIEYERAQAAAGRAEAGLNETKVYHGFTRITAPVSGVVTKKEIDPGSMAVPGMPLLTIEDTSSYRVEAKVDEKFSGRISAGMEASVVIESLGTETKGTISEVVPSIDPVSRSFSVKVMVKSGGLRNGQYARVSIPIGAKAALLVPANSVVEKGQLTGVYTVDANSVIAYRLVRTGRVYGDRVEILSGLTPGERVVVEGMEKALDGALAEAIR